MIFLFDSRSTRSVPTSASLPGSVFTCLDALCGSGPSSLAGRFDMLPAVQTRCTYQAITRSALLPNDNRCATMLSVTKSARRQSDWVADSCTHKTRAVYQPFTKLFGLLRRTAALIERTELC
jgi:hypothetical protein